MKIKHKTMTFKTREWKKNNKSEMGRWTAIGFLGQCVHWNFAMSAPKSVDCPLHSLTRPDTTPLCRPHVRIPSQGRNTRIHGNFHPHRRVFYPPVFRLAACIPRIIRILQLSHRTILTNKRHIVITSATPISFFLYNFLAFVIRLISISRIEKRNLFARA